MNAWKFNCKVLEKKFILELEKIQSFCKNWIQNNQVKNNIIKKANLIYLVKYFLWFPQSMPSPIIDK